MGDERRVPSALRRYSCIVCVGILCGLLCLSLGQVPYAQAYYERAPVTIKLSSISVHVTAGSTATLSCRVTPATERQLPGCGMAGCPQTCGSGCLDKNGWCTCAGTTYKTYATKVSAKSSASNIARASYANGTLKISGIAKGTATITLTGKLSKHKDATKTLRITVAQGSGSSASGGSGSSTSSGTTSASSPNAGAHKAAQAKDGVASNAVARAKKSKANGTSASDDTGVTTSSDITGNASDALAQFDVTTQGTDMATLPVPVLIAAFIVIVAVIVLRRYLHTKER